MRETGLRTFLRQLLPDAYYVGSGFVFDARDSRSRQLDVVIALDPPMARVFEKDAISYLPCESVIAAVEVKSTLNRAEVKAALTNAASLRELRPFGDQLFTSARQGGAPLESTDNRIFYSLVALSSDLAEDDWARREWARLQETAKELGVSADVVDRVVVLDRGQVIIPEGKGQELKAAETRVAGQWFLNLWNHLDREASRRKPLDPDIYMSGHGWQSLS